MVKKISLHNTRVSLLPGSDAGTVPEVALQLAISPTHCVPSHRITCRRTELPPPSDARSRVSLQPLVMTSFPVRCNHPFAGADGVAQPIAVGQSITTQCAPFTLVKYSVRTRCLSPVMSRRLNELLNQLSRCYARRWQRRRVVGSELPRVVFSISYDDICLWSITQFGRAERRTNSARWLGPTGQWCENSHEDRKCRNLALRALRTKSVFLEVHPTPGAWGHSQLSACTWMFEALGRLALSTTNALWIAAAACRLKRWTRRFH